MMACRRVGTNEFDVLAWADKHTVFRVTDNDHCRNKCNGNVVQGTKWYRTALKHEGYWGAWGFAGGNDEIHLYGVDVKYENGQNRLSYYVGASIGGWRCGEETYLHLADKPKKSS